MGAETLLPSSSRVGTQYGMQHYLFELVTLALLVQYQCYA